MFERFNKFSDKQKTLVALGIFALLIAVFYGNTLLNGFVLDDRKIIEENEYNHSLRYLPKVVTGCIWEYTHGGCEGKTLHYRPVHSLSNLLVYQISSKPWVFHFVNLLYFFAAASLVFVFTRLLTKKFLPALLAGIIFAAHPINNEVVNWISAVSELTPIIFVLLTFIYYIKYRQEKVTRYLMFAYAGYFLAMLSKETTLLVVPPLILALDVLIFRFPIKKLFHLKNLQTYALFGVPVAVYWGMRTAVLGGLGGLQSKGDYLGDFSFIERINAMFNLFAYSLKEILYPYPLSFFHEVEIGSNLTNTTLLGSLLVFTFFLFAIYFFIRSGKNLLAFSLIWFFVFFSPILVFFKIAGENNIFFERYLFGSSIGFALIFGYFLNGFIESKFAFLASRRRTRKMRIKFGRRFSFTLSKNIHSFIVRSFSFIHPPKHRAIVVVFLLGVFVLASWLVSFSHNRIWADNITFLSATLQHKPQAVSLRDFYAYELLTIQGDAESAKVEYERIVAEDPNYRGITHVYNHLGNYYNDKEEFEQAEAYYKKSMEAGKDTNYRPFNNLGALYLEQGDYLGALTNFCQALQVDPEAQEPQFNFSRVAGMISSIEDDTFIFLYQDVMSGGAFRQTPQAGILFREKSCSYGSCLYTFTLQFEENEREALFPFLIMAKAFPSEVIRVQKAEFRALSNEILLTIDEQYENKLLTFYFPTCTGKNYVVQVSEL